MKLKILLIALLSVVLFGFDGFSQSTERPRPNEWNDLVYGGRFMDIILPIPVQGELTSDTWGAANVVPRYTENGIEDNERSYWGGNARMEEDGKYHLILCGWPENSPKGHMFWSKSTVFHAIADNSLGPYRVKDTIGAGHNPEFFKISDGRYVIYVIDGYYIAETINGPWKYDKFEFNPRDRRIIEGLSNLTFAQREDGSYLMVCRGGGVWFSETGISPYNQVTDKRVYPPVEGRFEDPVIWRTNIQYHMIVNDWYGRIAYYLRSKDGINWKVEPGEAYLPGITKYEDGTVEEWFKYERIKVLQDEFGRATQAHFAVIDTLKRQDLSNDNHSSKHVCVPLTVGRLLTIIDKKPISQKTKTITVKIEAEDDFNPQTDIDINSLRFGASEEVNFGRGSRVIKTEKSGDDLIITFNGADNGITIDNFVAKMLGRTSKGKLLFGYARLPGVNYLEPALSACLPVISPGEKGLNLHIEIQNFGQVASKTADIKIVCRINNQEVEVAKGRIPKLNPFQKTDINLTCKNLFEKGVEYEFTVIINPGVNNPVLLNGKLTPLQ